MKVNSANVTGRAHAPGGERAEGVYGEAAWQGLLCLMCLCSVSLTSQAVVVAQDGAAQIGPSQGAVLEEARQEGGQVRRSALSVARAMSLSKEGGLSERHALRLVVSGGTGGASGRWLDLSAADRLGDALRAQGHQVRVQYYGPGAATDGRTVLFLDEGLNVTLLHHFLSAPPFRRAVLEESVEGLVTPWSTTLVRGDVKAPVGEGLPAAESVGRLIQWRNARDEVAIGYESGEPGESLSAESSSWELLDVDILDVTPAGSQESSRFVTMARPWGEGARRAGLVEAQCAEAREQGAECLIVDAGDALDGYSMVDGQALSLHRRGDWTALKEMGLSALAPASHELLAGPEALKEEARAHGVSLVSANVFVKGGAGESLAFEPFVIRRGGGLSVAIVGLTPPEASLALPRAVASRLRIAEPREVLAGLRERLRVAAGGEPDVVVLLTREASSGLARDLEGVDAIFGDFSHVVLSPGRRVDHPHSDMVRRVPFVMAHSWGGQVLTWDLYAASSSSSGAGAPGGGGGVDERVAVAGSEGGVEGEPGGVVAHRGGISRTVLRALPVSPELPAVSSVTKRVQAVRQEVYMNTESIVIPTPSALIAAEPGLRALLRASPPYSAARDDEALNAMLARRPASLNAAMWQLLATNLLRERTGANVALLRPLPRRGAVDGPLRLLHVVEHLAIPDRVVVVRLEGPSLEALVGAAEGLPPSIRPSLSGYDAATSRVGGRGVDPARTYTVALTDQLAAHPALAPHLANARRQSAHFVVRGWDIRPDPEGDLVSLKGLVIQGLQSLLARRKADVESPISASSPYAQALSMLAQPQGAAVTPEWFLDLNGLSLDLQQYRNVGDISGYSAVRETRATTPNNVTYALNFDASLGRDGPRATWFFRSQAAFGELRAAGEEPVETRDDLVFQTELRAHALSLTGRGAQLPVVPFVNVLYDTEFTRLEEARARQQELRETLGVVLRPPVFEELKVGLLVRQDFVAEDNFEFGFQSSGLQKARLGAFSVETVFDLRYFFPDDGDGEDQLGLTFNLRSTLGAPLLDRLALGLFADLFVFQGKVESLRSPRASLILGLTLRYDRLWALSR